MPVTVAWPIVIAKTSREGAKTSGPGPGLRAAAHSERLLRSHSRREWSAEELSRPHADGGEAEALQPLMVKRALVIVTGSPGSEAAQQRVAPLKHRVVDALACRRQAHRLIVAVAAATGPQRANAEEEHDGAVVLLSPEVVQLLHR
jgi:hypothetical protein